MAAVSLDSLTRFVQEASRRYQLLGNRVNQGQHPPPAQDVEVKPAQTRSISLALETAWERAAKASEQGKIVTSIVTGWNRGGLLVHWDELQGFVPASQLRDVTMFECEQPREDKLARWVGEELELKIIELDRERNRLVFSERATLWGPHDGEVILKHIKPGETRRGQVSNLCEFGAFVDLGGVDGLIHLSELSWRRISHPRELLTIGQQVDVYVIDVDRDDHRVALSIKRLRPNPWSTVSTNFHIGQDVEAVVTNIVDFGVFAQIEDGLEGLVHISELLTEVRHPSEAVSVGDQVTVRIVRIDSSNHRLGLSMRQAQQNNSSEDQRDEHASGDLTDSRDYEH
ncbi:MAG: 30S ribosomal protein S1 [Anaerolineae bacterium]